MSRALTITSASGRMCITLPPGAILRRPAGDCPAALDPSRALAASRRRVREWADRARVLMPQWLGEHRNAQGAETQDDLHPHSGNTP